ncbi:MAG: monofunctional biosynthetic peptidoglycan transglycosylase [Gammaproteobacteria bacterium]|nr:monofunctional biosynthetic peptidoglycan transglycosylase [Gammaproteobacteria bacterium]
MRAWRKTGIRWLWRGVLLLCVGLFLYQVWILAHIGYWIEHNPASTAFMEARAQDGTSSKAHRWVPYARISPHLKRALIVAEDARFLEHEGFDWEGIQTAYEKNLKKGRVVAGGSTISQQLAKNLFLSGERSMLRKMQEAVITLMLEQLMSKRRIFEIYLNVIEWGDGIFGAEAAARHYYATSVSALNAEQSAWLAAIVTNPRYYDTHRAARGAQRKASILLARMPMAQVP